MSEQTQTILNLLHEVPLFSGVSIEALEGLADVFVMVELPEGESLYRNEEETDGLFVVDSGQLGLLDGQGRQVEVVRRAEVVGKEALNYLPVRQNTAITLTAARVFFLPNQQVNALYADVPAFKETASVLFNSSRLASEIPMAWLEPGEKIHLMARKHPAFLLFRVIPPFVAFGAVWVLMMFVSSVNAFWSLAGLVAGFLFALLRKLAATVLV